MAELSPALPMKRRHRPVKKVTYHDPCHLKRGLGISEEPRQLIRDAGYELVEMNDADACCGFGGDALIDASRAVRVHLKAQAGQYRSHGSGYGRNGLHGLRASAPRRTR